MISLTIGKAVLLGAGLFILGSWFGAFLAALMVASSRHRGDGE